MSSHVSKTVSSSPFLSSTHSELSPNHKRMPFQRFLLLAACLILFLLDPVLSTDDIPQVTFTTNVTAVQADQPFTARCQVDRYEVKGDENLIFGFWRKNSSNGLLISYYYEVNSSGERHWSIGYNGTKDANLAIDLHSNITYPACEVTIHPTKLANYEYYCTFKSDTLPKFYPSN